MNTIKYIILFSCIIGHFILNGQLKPIPIGTWRSHFNYNKAEKVVKVGNKIFSAAQNGFFEYDITSQETTILNKSDGFFDTNISQIAFEKSSNILLIYYRSGALDLATLDSKFDIKEIKNILQIKNANTILDSKLSNQIIFNNKIAYVSTDFGIVQVDLSKLSIFYQLLFDSIK